MNRIVVSQDTNPCYNLALEETLLSQADSGTMLYLWVNRPCVVLGRNQNPYMECDMEYLKACHIRLVRRKSGGGAVYQDTGNLNYTFINREGEGSREMQRRVLLGMLEELGMEASCSGRNDILVNGRKISGQAAYCEGGNEYLHGTLMVSVDLRHLADSLRPSRMKLESKGIRSVAGRVINMAECAAGVTVNQVMECLMRQFFLVYGPSRPVIYKDESQGRPRQQDVYESREWIVDSCPGYTACLELPFMDGILKLRLQVKEGRIVNIQGSSDSLLCSGIDWIQNAFQGQPFDEEQIIKRIRERGNKDERI